MPQPSRTSKFTAQVSCYIIGAAIGAAIGSRITYLVDGVPTDLRYGGAGLGGFVGWLVTPLLLSLAMVSGVSMVRPPSPYADEEAQAEHRANVIGCGLALLVLGAIGNLVFLGYTLLEQSVAKGLPVLLAVVSGGCVLAVVGSTRGSTQ